MKNVKYISLVTENLFEIVGIFDDGIVCFETEESKYNFEVDKIKVNFSKDYMKNIADIEDVLIHNEITNVKYYYNDGTIEVKKVDCKDFSTTIIGTKILINIIE